MTVSKIFWVGLVALIAGALLIGLAVRHGDVHAVLILFIPIIYGTSGYLALGALLIFVGFFLTLMGYFEPVMVSVESIGMNSGNAPSQSPGQSTGGQPGAGEGNNQGPSYGGFLFIGPVPIVFGNRAGWFPYIVILALVTVIVFVLFAVFLFVR
jgi:uncharacterized protein (TIGR00304 family)